MLVIPRVKRGITSYVKDGILIFRLVYRCGYVHKCFYIGNFKDLFERKSYINAGNNNSYINKKTLRFLT